MKKKHFSYYLKTSLFIIFVLLIAYVTYASIENIFFTKSNWNKNSSLEIKNASSTVSTYTDLSLNTTPTSTVFHLKTQKLYVECMSLLGS